MSQSKVAVVILNYNGKLFLEKFLPSVTKFSKNHTVVVADNNSTDDSISFLKNNYPSVQIIQNPVNTGFAQGYNNALKHVDQDYYVLLNSDVEVTENWIGNVISLMDSNSNIAACQPKILDYNNKTKFEYAGAAGGFIDKYGYPFCRGRVFNSLEEDKSQYNNSTEVFWATGACMFVRSKAFWEVGGFDGDYFAHMEEIDLCWRLKNIGYKIYVEPKSIVYHVGGGTLNKLSSRKTFLNFRNNLTTLTKNHPPLFLFLKIIWRMKLDGIAAFKFLFDGQPVHFFAVIRAHFAFYGWLPRTLAKRKKAKLHPNFKYSMGRAYDGNVVLEHFIRKKNSFSELNQSSFLD
ncbi:MAG TPA: glycosyltransferase family 2 protein [Bacteroidia bacterium]|jgi:GT2 family glycosyltransferase|nr:glycosyltransferase family 2 protein [Bacteroidia bacterium]